MGFKNKTAIVTGAGQGIGFEICRNLAMQGGRVILNDIDPELSKLAAMQINQENKDACIALPGDSSKMEIIKKLVSEAVNKFGKLDIVVANAGITLFGDFLSYTPESFYKVMQVNLGGSFFLGTGSCQQMKLQSDGRIHLIHFFSYRTPGT